MTQKSQTVHSKGQILDLLIQHRLDIQKYGAAKIGLFGSFARNQQNDDSDVDLLVEFEDGKKTFKNLVHLSYYLQDLIPRKVQLVTWMGLADFVKREVTKEIEYVSFSD
ncbi:nucleotidyltransferase family protein [Persicitalea sp.]|uniref:nucleotidyltransferase family protein n=1 Tax=Persicitalea sp. TaxID=3100273 RepID=UPI00359313BE